MGQVRDFSPTSAGNGNDKLRMPKTDHRQHLTDDNHQQSDTSLHNEPQGIVYDEDEPDSVLLAKVFRFHYVPLDIKIMHTQNPTTEPIGIQFYDRLDDLNGDYYLSRGSIGQQHLSLYPQYGESAAYRLCPDAFMGYSKRPTNVDFYQTRSPYTVLGYHSSLDKDYQVKVIHTQNITPRCNVAFDADLMRMEGVYTNSRVNNNLLNFTTNYYSHDARYQLYAGAIGQRYTLGENGGLASDDVLRTMNSPTGMPVNLYGTGSTTKERTVFVHQSFNTVRQTQWLRPIKETRFDSVATDTIWHHIDSTTTTDTNSLIIDSLAEVTYSYRYIDTIVGYDTLLPHTPHLFNTGVVALDVQYDKFTRIFSDSIAFQQWSGRLYWTNDAYFDYRWHNPIKLKVGINIENSQGYALSTTHTEGLLSPFASADISLHRTILSLYAEQATNNGAHRYHASLIMPLDSMGKHLLHLGATQQKERPYMLYHFLNNTTTPTLPDAHIGKLQASYTYGDILELNLAATNLRHITVIDPTLTASTYNHAILLQSGLTLHLSAGWFHCHLQQMLQYASSPIYVPLFASKNSLYADTKLFHGALRAQIGIDLRYHTAFYANAYDPTYGIFYQQDLQTEVGNFLWGDIFLNLQIKRASIYAKAGHVNALWEQHPNYFLLPHYPGRKFGFFYGVTWQLFE